MKLKWETFKEGDTFTAAECGPICLDVDTVSREDDNDGWSFWIDETGAESSEVYETKEEAQLAAEKFAEDTARDILKALGV
jgi:hypothetical protein